MGGLSGLREELNKSIYSEASVRRLIQQSINDGSILELRECAIEGCKERIFYGTRCGIFVRHCASCGALPAIDGAAARAGPGFRRPNLAAPKENLVTACLGRHGSLL